MKPTNLFLFFLSAVLITACAEYEELVPEPEVQFIGADQAELINTFAGLTGDDPSACNLVFDPTEIPDVLCRILIDAQPGSEIVFLVDKTSSMSDDIDEVKRNINEIIDCLPEGVRLGAATYGDRLADGINWYTSIDLSEDYDLIRTFINAISVSGGGDLPESVYDGLFRVLDEMSWRDCDAPDRIIVMGDAPPITGARTDYEVEDVLQKAQSICPNTEFYPVIILEI